MEHSHHHHHHSDALKEVNNAFIIGIILNFLFVIREAIVGFFTHSLALLTDAGHNLSDVARASRIIYLNKTCYNGLYRVNNSGEFNSPFGKYKNPNIVNEPTLRAVSSYLNSNNIRIENKDYETILKEADKSSFVYLDPPYHPVSDSSNFTGYIQGGWGEADQVRLKEACDQLSEKGIKFLQSNSCVDFIKELYTDYQIHIIKANRAINSDGDKRGEVEEVLIKNYE